MNENTKTSNFLNAINKYAKEQSDAIRLEAEEFKQQEIEKATKEGITDAYKLIQKNIAVEKAKIVSEYAMREQNSRQQLFIRRAEIVASVFSKAKDKLIAFTKTEEYTEYLRTSASEIAQAFDNNSCVIYISKNDEDKAQLLAQLIPSSTVETDDTILIGGIKGYCESMKIVADNTLDTKLYDQRKWFSETSNLKVV